MAQEHSPKEGEQDPAQRHHLEECIDEQQEYFSEERRRAARPRQLIRTSPPEDPKPTAGQDKN